MVYAKTHKICLLEWCSILVDYEPNHNAWLGDHVRYKRENGGPVKVLFPVITKRFSWFGLIDDEILRYVEAYRIVEPSEVTVDVFCK